MRTATLTKVGNMEVQWKKEGNSTRYSGGTFTKGATFSDTDHAINEDTTNCYASYRKGTPYTVTVENGTVTGPGVKYPNGNGKFLVGDTVNIKPNEKKSSDGTLIPFKEWTSEGVALASPTTPNTSFNVPTNDVTVTATYNPFDGAPVFTRTSDSSGTIAFQTAVKPDGGTEYFQYVEVGKETDPYGYQSIAPQPTTTSGASPYKYSVSASTYYAGDIQYLNAGDYRMAVTLNGERYLSDPFTVNYTAAPAGNYSDHVRVYNGSGTITSLSDGQCLATNADTSATPYTSGDYVARYDQSNGTLYLNGYQNDYQIIAPNSVIFADGDLNIEVVSDSSFSTSVSATSDLHGIRANGTLNISGSGKLTVTANGNGTVYGIYADKGVKISAPLDVRVGKVDSSKNGSLYGIYTKSGAISLSGNDMTVTATGGTSTVYGVYNAADTSTAITENGNITISGNLTVNLSNGSYNRGISSQGGDITLESATVKIPGSYRYGIFNRNGNVVIKSTSDVDISSDISDNNGICTYSGGDLTIENSAVKVSAHGYAANLEYGKLLIENSDVELTRTNGLVACVVNTHINAVNKIDLSGSGSVTLTASGNQTSAMIGGKVTATPGTKLEKGTYYPDLKTYDGEYDAASDKTVLKFVHESAAPTTYTVSFDANGGTGTMAAVTGVSGEYTLPANGFTAPAGKQFKAWSVDGNEKAVGDKITVTANTTVTAVWEDIPVVTYTVSGTATSFGSNTDNVILQLIAEGFSEADYEVFVKGNTASYTIEGVAAGTYTMKVMKNNHVTREYTVTVGAENVTQDVKIHLKGDITGDGKVNTFDIVKMNLHAKKKTELTGYELLCGDITGDGKVNTFDIVKANLHAKKKTLLW